MMQTTLRAAVLAGVTITALGLFAADAAKPKLSPEERRARRAARLAAEGGLVERPVDGCVIRIKLDTDKLKRADLEKPVNQLRSAMRLSVEVLEKGETSTNAVGALVQFCEKGKDVPMLLTAPEENWASINLTRLWEDHPDDATAKMRVGKEMWRGLAFALGAANTFQMKCLMRPIRRARDLDREPVEMVSPQPLMAMMQTASAMGFSHTMRVTYRKACQEGWASAPTNDVQKAIWKEVHTVPTAPLQLKK